MWWNHLATNECHERSNYVASRAGAACIGDSLGIAVAAELGLTFLRQDVTSEAQWLEVTEEIKSRHGGLHILVNNAGICGSRDKVSPGDTAFADWRKVFAVNLDGVFLAAERQFP